jgi:dihydrofolate synthase/folylpolyglutamate synthase
MRDYAKAIRRLYELQKFGIKLGLNSTESLLKRLGDPHRSVKCLHIAGTNGKGSVAAMSEAALLAAGFKTGLYVSPHLVRFTERFRVGGREISRKRAVELAEAVWQVVDEREPPTFFEFVTAMAFLLFTQQRVDLAVLEVGMGGRLDATNLCLPAACVITNIGLEHKQYLGNTLSAIAYEKAGIIKPYVPLIHGVRQRPARQVVEKRAAKLKAPIIRQGRDITCRREADGRFSLRGRRWVLSQVSTNLVGRHQAENACLALGALEALAGAGFPVTADDFKKGLNRVFWPGRLEKVPTPALEPTLWLDGAHNPPAARILVRSLDLVREGRSPLVMVLGLMADKDLKGMLSILVPMADYVIYTRPVYERAARPEVLAAAAPAIPKPSRIIGELGRAMAEAKKLAGPNGVVLVTGSLFTVGEAKILLKPNQTSDLP